MTAVMNMRDIEALVDAHGAEVWRYLRFLGCDESLAEDLRQDVFVYVLRNPIEDRGRAAAGGYLRKVARSLFINLMRREARKWSLEDIEAADRVWQSTRPEDDSDPWLDALRNCLQTLDEGAQRAIEMHYRDRAGIDAIAAKLGNTVAAVKSMLQRARASLRACMERKVKI
ncbi:MAG: RNA polymerase sigma factor [Planctomycetaceae bacterium]|nr:RNA polymerase sigma factor [Planctomycetaceae bacterium]